MTKKSKFKQTKELVRIALNDGMTQKEVANMCRTKQPQVSKWNNGTALATTQQLKPLLDRFGHKLRQSPFKIYQFPNEKGSPSFLKVEGKLLLRERFQGSDCTSEPSAPLWSAATSLRLSVHMQNDGTFAMIFEYTQAPAPQKTNTNEITFNDRHAQWLGFSPNGDDTRVFTFDGEGLLDAAERLDAFREKGGLFKRFAGLQVLPKLVAEFLTRNGVPLKQVEVFNPAP